MDRALCVAHVQILDNNIVVYEHRTSCDTTITKCHVVGWCVRGRTLFIHTIVSVRRIDVPL